MKVARDCNSEQDNFFGMTFLDSLKNPADAPIRTALIYPRTVISRRESSIRPFEGLPKRVAGIKMLK